MKKQSTLTCPNCKDEVTEEMPEDSCRFFWQCPSCNNVVRPKEGDCCVYCSYGDIACPSKQ